MAHKNYEMDLTVEVFVVNNGKVLLRKHDKYGMWLSVGGHLEPNEDPNEAAIREVKEEVGLDVDLISTFVVLDYEKEKYKHLIPPAYMNRHSINEIHEHITMIFFAKTKNTELKQGTKEISPELKWFNLNELENLNEGITRSVKEYAKNALKYC
jgi:ADP-ribose pyrophosphatase YjhB (NUDIX family)